MTSPADRIARMASAYDATGVLSAEVLRRLAYRQRHSGKTCDRCRSDKPLGAFSRDQREPDGLRRYCRACDAGAYLRRKAEQLPEARPSPLP